MQLGILHETSEKASIDNIMYTSINYRKNNKELI